MIQELKSLISDNIPDPEPKDPPPKAEPWLELGQSADAPDTELIRFRFLCRGGGLLLIGQTGTGKSSFTRQMALHFAIGQPFAGLAPARPLCSLIIQAENDDQDEAEMRQGIVDGSGFSEEQLRIAGPLLYHHREQCQSGTAFFLKTLEPLMEQVKPDLIWIDPVLAFLGGDQNSQEIVGTWLRNCLNPLLTKFNCAAVLVHHTAKITLKNLKGNYGPSDLGYLGAGSAEFANWSRAIMCLMPSGVPSIYELHAPKRGRRLGWRDSDGATPTTKKYVCHAREFGRICWHEPKGEEASFAAKPGANGRPIPTVDQFMGILPGLIAGKLARESLKSAAQIRNIFSERRWKRDSYAGVCEEALAQGVAQLIEEGRGNRTKLYGRPEVVEAYRAEKGLKNVD